MTYTDLSYITAIDGRDYKVTFEVINGKLWSRVDRIRKDGSTGLRLSTVHDTARAAVASVWEAYKADCSHN